MNNSNNSLQYLIVVLLFISSFQISCVSTKNVPYFQDISVANKSVLENTALFVEPKIQNDDILSISIFTIDPINTAVVNQSTAINTPGQSPISGYLVDKNGEIELSIIGTVKLAGLTTFQAKDLIKSKVSEYYKNPSVQVRFANFKVTVFGEVAKPAAYTVPNEKVSVLDAIALAGDLTIYGKRDNIMLIRDNNGKKEFARLNLSASDIFTSPYFYLRQNDVIYVEPTKAKIAANNSARTQTITIIGTLVSVLTLVVSRFF
jgi:polysaccharide export outer membrane protein